MSIVGQLIVFEAVFGMFYLFAVSGDLPSPLEMLGIAIAIFAVWLSIRRLQSNKAR
jgi:drug/metabolite transporter (DMT)-like permease